MSHPPPLFLLLNDEVRGPFEWDRLCKLAESGVITPATDSSPRGDGPWTAIRDAGDYRGVFPLRAQLQFKARPFEAVNRPSDPPVDHHALIAAANRGPAGTVGRCSAGHRAIGKRGRGHPQTEPRAREAGGPGPAETRAARAEPPAARLLDAPHQRQSGALFWIERNRRPRPRRSGRGCFHRRPHLGGVRHYGQILRRDHADLTRPCPVEVGRVFRNAPF